MKHTLKQARNIGLLTLGLALTLGSEPRKAEDGGSMMSGVFCDDRKAARRYRLGAFCRPSLWNLKGTCPDGED